MDARALQLHASAVAIGGRAVLILGAPGSGKSTLALEMIALGAALVADDRVDVARTGDVLRVTAPPRLAGLIEARGTGLIRCAHVPGADLHLVVDLDRVETDRLPQRATRDLLGRAVPVINGPVRPGLAAALTVLLGGGTLADPEAPVTD